MDPLDKIESKSIHILREAYHHFRRLAMLWSVGKDSTVLVHLAQKAFFGHVPFPLIHIDTGYKIPQMIEYRDALAFEWKLNMIYGKNQKALDEGESFPLKKLTPLQCCKKLKTDALQGILNGTLDRYKLNLQTQKYEIDSDTDPYHALMLGIRADEEGSRSKERYFSPRGQSNHWDVENQPAEFWGYYYTEFAEDTHVRIHPLLDWTELDIWRYIQREKIPIIDLYFDQGNGTRYRSLGCQPCTHPIESKASNVDEIIEELSTGKLAQVSERSGRAQDKEDRGTLEILRRQGYM